MSEEEEEALDLPEEDNVPRTERERQILAEDKAKRIIPRERAVKIWTTELGNPASTFQWDPNNHRQFKCGVCHDTPVIRCKAMTLRQHCKRNKHVEALKRFVGGKKHHEEEPEEKPLVKQAAVFSTTTSSSKKPAKKKTKVAPPPPEPSEDEQDGEEEVQVEKKKKKKAPAPKKRERAPKKPKSPQKKKKQKTPVDEEEEDSDAIDIAPVSRDLEDDWKRYVAKNLGPKQREAMFARRLRRIMDEFENGGGRK
jgi:hypothetical protein